MRANGFTLLELVVVVVAIAILAGFALDRLLPLVGRAQRVAFMQVQSELQTALLLAAADRITSGESQTLPELAGANPMSLLLKPPGNYLGELGRGEAERAPGHTWFYDDRKRAARLSRGPLHALRAARGAEGSRRARRELSVWRR